MTNLRAKISSFYHMIDRKYWIYIIVVLLVHLPAQIITAYALSNLNGQECNSISSILFTKIGIIPVLIIHSLFLFGFIFLIGVQVKNGSDDDKWMRYAIYIMIIGLSIDSFHDILMITHNPLAHVTLNAITTAYTANGLLPHATGC